VLTGGHQLINAEQLAQGDAVKIVTEDSLATDPQILKVSIEALLRDNTERQRLSQHIHELAHPNAARDIARLLLSSIKQTKAV
jgi:UDP-N-acetylglucosamine:LPS N-acetylglucosamine transferase